MLSEILEYNDLVLGQITTAYQNGDFERVRACWLALSQYHTLDEVLFYMSELGYSKAMIIDLVRHLKIGNENATFR